jgi:SAM-dependent methyltransferase
MGRPEAGPSPGALIGQVHPAASGGFGAAAEIYERSRPDYPAEAIDRLTQELEIERGGVVLDLGAGTGKLTRMLAPTGARVVALEPVESMRRRFAEVLPGVPLVGGMAEALPFPDETFDAAVAAQAFHWFQADLALEAVSRVLRPSGRLGLLWNVRNETVPWVKELTRLIEPYEARAPREHWKAWRQAFSRSDRFGTLHQRRFPHEQRLGPEGLVDRVASMSFIASLPAGDRESVFEEVRRLVATHPELAGREEFTLPYITDLYWCSRA